MEIGARIIHLREQKGWSQRELAHQLELNVSVMNRIEKGERPVKDRELDKIATVLQVSADYLLGRQEQCTILEDTSFRSFIVDPDLKKWYKDLPNNREEDLRKLRRIWEAFIEG